jgi:cytidyltransferase-like protein
MRVMVDMSATLLHYGHVRLLKRAKEIGTVVVALTSDEEVLKRKGYKPELSFQFRKEVIEAIRYVDEVVEVPWMITDEILRAHKIDALFHGDDNSNDIPREKLIVVPRTEGISSSEMRIRSLNSIVSLKNRKALLTAGPGSLLVENLLGLEPCFGRGDAQYQAVEDRVLARLRKMTGHAQIVRLQGSASLALEIAIRNFVAGRVAVVTTGYYAERLANICRCAKPLISHLDVVPLCDIGELSGRYDWLVTVYTETSVGLRNDILEMRALADRLGAKLLVDATGSIALEDGHEVADVIAYSSCKGLFGLTGASFIAYNDAFQNNEASFYLNLANHIGRGMTGPYHAIYSIDGALARHEELRESVRIGKDIFCRRYSDRLVRPLSEQPLLCTLVRGVVKANDDNVILYQPRAAPPGTSVVCHLGEGHLGKSARGDIYSRITIAD